MKIVHGLLFLLLVVPLSCDNGSSHGRTDQPSRLCDHECPVDTQLFVDDDLSQCYCIDNNDEKHGRFIEWYENGQKKIEREYWYGALVGLNQTWYENGDPKGEFVWLVDGNSFYIAFRETFNGNTILEGFYKDGLPYGDWAFYDLTDGYKTMDAKFNEGVYCGTVQCYDDNGQPAACAEDVIDTLIDDGCDITATGAECPECPAFYE